MICMGLVHNLTGLIIARVFLGFMEAGYFPGVSFYLTLWYHLWPPYSEIRYCRGEHSFRLAIFFAMATMAGAFGGILAYGIGKMEGVRGRDGWSWIFMYHNSIHVHI